jgi:hypothetical protein
VEGCIRRRIWPELVGVVKFFDAHRAGLGARLEQPRGRDARHEFAQAVVVEDAGELRDVEAAVAGRRPHGELVAEVAGDGIAQAGQPHMLAEVGGRLHVVVVERDDLVYHVRAREVTDGVGDVRLLREVGHEVELVNALARPILVLERLLCDDEDLASQLFGLLNERDALEEAGEAEEGEGLGHGGRSLINGS